MKAFDVVGYAWDCEVYCADCADEEMVKEGYPVFVDSEWDSYPVCAECGERIEEVSLTDEGERYETEQRGPEEEDYLLCPTGTLGSRTLVSQDGKVLGVFDDDDEALAFVRQHADDESFWPNAWKVSDHGNAHLLTL